MPTWLLEAEECHWIKFLMVNLFKDVKN